MSLKTTSMLSIVLASFLLTGCFSKSSDLISTNKNTTAAAITTIDKSSSVELRGSTTGYGTLREDGRADFGLVLKSFNRQDLFQIELDDLMSTSTDRISVFGYNLDLPSNVALPDQRERYIFSIRLNKPQYRIYFEPGKETSAIILHGQFPFSDVIDGFRNGTSLLQLAGLFNILSYTEHVGAAFDTPQVIQQNLSVGQNPLTETQTVSAPQSVPRDFSFVAVSLLKSSHGQNYFPTDIKVVAPHRSAQIKVERQRSALFTGLFHSSFADSDAKGLSRYKMSLQFSADAASVQAPLGFVENLAYQNAQLSFQSPALPAGLYDIGTSVQVFDSQTGEQVFTAYELGTWNQSIDMSDFESLRQAGKKYRLEVSLHATTSNDIPTSDESLFENTELVSKNAVEI